MPALAVTDTNNMFGALEFAMEAQKAASSRLSVAHK
jgi:DNA polymerase III alpha subunit